MQLRKSSLRNLLPRLASILAVIIVAVACEEGPLGFDDLGRGELVVHQITFEADSVDCFSEQIALGRSVRLIGGADSLTESRILISIDGLDSIGVFDSVKLILKRLPTDEIKQSPVSFKLYPLTSEWDEAGCTWMQKDISTKWRDPGGEFDESDLLAEIEVNDDSTEIRLDSSSIATYRQGFVMVPQNDGFSYLYSMETADTLLNPSIIGFKGNDTTRFKTVAGSEYYADIHDVTIIKPYSAPTSDTLIGAGFAWRTYIHFSIDTIPQDIDVTSSELWVTYENYFSPEDTLFFFCFKPKEPYAGRFTTISSVAGKDSLVISNEDSISFPMVDIAQFWVDEPDSNFGMIMSHSFLYSNPSYGQENSIYALGRITGVPKLTITYTTPPDGRFPGGEE